MEQSFTKRCGNYGLQSEDGSEGDGYDSDLGLFDRIAKEQEKEVEGAVPTAEGGGEKRIGQSLAERRVKFALQSEDSSEDGDDETPADPRPGGSRGQRKGRKPYRKRRMTYLSDSDDTSDDSEESDSSSDGKRPKPMDGHDCDQKCSLFGEEDRLDAFQKFKRRESRKKQYKWIRKHVTQESVKKHKAVTTKPQHEVVRKYYLPREGRRVRVCRKFFIDTLAISYNKVRYAFLDQKEK